tara:strand:- start:408 stop:1184 length:777 start_codon:yes stop_codon:yes gene_type:complete
MSDIKCFEKTNDLTIVYDEIFPTSIFRFYDKTIDNDEIAKAIYDIRDAEMKEPNYRMVSKSNYGGYHTKMNLDSIESMNPVRDLIIDCINELITGDKYWNRDIIDKDHFGGMWAMINNKGDYNASHNHPKAWVSGVYYVKTPQPCPPIKFKDPVGARSFTRDYNSQQANDLFTIQPEPGLLVLFPSWLNHQVDANKTTEDRIAVSFNMSYSVYKADKVLADNELEDYNYHHDISKDAKEVMTSTNYYEEKFASSNEKK